MSQSTPSATPLHFQSVTQLSQMLSQGQISSVEITQTLLERIKTHQHLGAFLAVDENISIQQAKQADVLRAQNKNNTSPLVGIPVAYKDAFVTTDMPCTAASKMLQGYVSPFNATVVENLQQAGMVTLGKTNCDEFAMGNSGENSAFFPVANPWGTNRIPGGSSAGSATAVAAGLAPAAMGTDTGGSIRQPSSFTGITGIKPTYGRCSRHGIIAFASSLDQAGPMAHSAQDCALLLQAMAGFDQRDATSIERPVDNYPAQITALREGATVTEPLKGLRIGLPREFFDKNVSPEVLQIIHEALTQYQKLGAQLVDITLPHTQLSIPVYYIIAPAEASANLSRFDGVRYGYRAKARQGQHMDLEEMYERSRSEAFGPEVKRRIVIGTYVLSHGYYDAYYLKAQKIRRIIALDFQEAFKQCDIIAGPVAPTVAWRRGEVIDDPVSSYLADIFTLPASLSGLPGMSIPAGLSPTEKLPVGLQLVGNYWQEGQLLHAAHAFQQATPWHTYTPAGY